MPAITEAVPEALQPELEALRAALAAELPAKVLDRNVVIGTWNIRAFADFQRLWQGDPAKSPKRDLFSLRCIAEVLERFDVVAVQEVRGNLACLRHVAKYLNRHGDHWGLLLTDVTKGTAGNNERLAFLFDMRKVRPSGLACELVLPPEAGGVQFARTPYAVSFRSGGKTFILVTLHVVYGGDPADREPELRAAAAWLRDWARDEHAWDHSLIVLGDFNIDRVGDPRYQALTETGLRTHPAHASLPSTLFHKPSDPSSFKHYDQVAWFEAPGMPLLSLHAGRGGHFDLHRHVLKDVDRRTVSYMLSDHYPLWVEFLTAPAAVAPAAPLKVSFPQVLFVAAPGTAATAEWVEVANDGEAPVDMTGWTLHDEAGNTFRFPAAFTLAPGAVVKVHTGTGTDSREDLYWGRASSVWNDSGDTATLRDAQGAEVARTAGP